MLSLEQIIAMNDEAVKHSRKAASAARREMNRKPFVVRRVNSNGNLIRRAHKTVWSCNEGFVTV